MKKIIIALCAVALSACAPLSEILSLASYEVDTQHLQYDPSPLTEAGDKTTVVFIAGQKGTEIFDLLAPYEVFARSGSYRLIVVAPQKAAIPLWKGVGLVPHTTFDELDSLPDFKADVIVVPNIIDEDNARIQRWLRKNVEQADYVLSVCEGMRVIAHADVFQQAVVTTFSTTVNELENKHDQYQWIKNRRYIKSGRLISTAGVSAAVEGALALVAEMRGTAHAETIRQDIGYRFALGDASYNPQAHGLTDLWRLFKKVTLGENLNLVFLLRPSVSEMKMASVMDTYARTLPASLVSVTENNQPIISKHGLKFVPKTTVDQLRADQLHILGGTGQASPTAIGQQTTEVFHYEDYDSYALPQLLAALSEQYSQEFIEVLARLLDYPADRL